LKLLLSNTRNTNRFYYFVTKPELEVLTNCARIFRRFDPAYSLLKERVRQGEVGHVQTIKVCSRDSPLPTIAYLSTSGIFPG
jgi:hypothetical protein